MNVCILASNYYRSSGVAVAIQRLVSAMAGSGVEFYFASGGAPTAGGAIPAEDLSWVPVARYRRFDFYRAGVFPAQAIRFAAWLRRIGCDVVHAHHRRLALVAKVLQPCHGASVVYTQHGAYPKSRIFSALCPDIVTGVSPSVMNYLRAE